MIVLGLTGGIGSGKSTVARLLDKKGALVIDADEVAKESMATGTLIWKKMVKRFGERVLLEDKTIDRRKVGEIVFNDAAELAFLNRLTHPAIAERIKEMLKEANKSKALVAPKSFGIVAVDAPLLAEVGLLPYVDFVVVVTAKRSVRLNRLEKLGFSHAEAEARIQAQTTDDKRVEFADHVIRNEKSLRELERKVEELWQKIQQIKQGKTRAKTKRGR